MAAPRQGELKYRQAVRGFIRLTVRAFHLLHRNMKLELEATPALCQSPVP